MTSPDKFSHPELETLRNEMAPDYLQARILEALMPDQAKLHRQRTLRVSLVTAVAVAVFAIFLLTPRASFAAAVSKVLKVFQSIRHYHVSSYQILDGQPHRVSETWVNGAKHTFKAYDPAGNPLPDSSQIGDMAEKLTQQFRGMTPKQMEDPKLMDKLMAQVSPLGPNAGFFTMQITIDGKVVSELPPEVKNAIAMGQTSGPMGFNVGGEPDVAYLCGLLKDEKIWTITPDQTLNGKKVDKYETRGAGVVLFVDRATTLPVRLRLNTGAFGAPVTMQDDFDYPPSGP